MAFAGVRRKPHSHILQLEVEGELEGSWHPWLERLENLGCVLAWTDRYSEFGGALRLALNHQVIEAQLEFRSERLRGVLVLKVEDNSLVRVQQLVEGI